MRRVIQCSATIFFSVCTTFAVAGGYDYAKEDLNGYTLQPNLKVSDESDFTRDGNAFYFFGGYLYTDRLLKSSQLSISNSQSTQTYAPKSVLPSTFNGLQIGAGKEWSRHVDFQLSYFQHFIAKKSSTFNGLPFSTSVKFNGILADVGYIFNPDDQFQVMAKVGAVVGEFYNTFVVSGASYFITDDETKIDPAAGVEFLFQFTKHVGFRVSTMYIANTQTSLSNGEINALAALSYTL